ncbi:hypothetical protein [Actinokineospora bangkokensis]|uniref:hypothetical protein n=1 Tax=Actinokineospora bangkokensis TaxID=1193682 RepID=UPI000A85510C|nr:hypothetical protein [Actinokineospora bangkokensis]
MSERVRVDVDALAKGGVDIQGLMALTRRICAELGGAVAQYQYAGGTGEMGKRFDQGYKPGAEQGVKFLALLSEVVGDAGGRTLDTAKSFRTTDDEATSSVPGNQG